MSFRRKHNKNVKDNLDDRRNRLNNADLYESLRTISRTVMMDVYAIDLDGDLNAIPKEAFDYRDNLLDAMVGSILLYGNKKE